jgi:hypothetical protein
MMFEGIPVAQLARIVKLGSVVTMKPNEVSNEASVM